MDLRRLARLDRDATSKRPRRPSTQANNNALPDNRDRWGGGQSDGSVPPQVSSPNNRDPNHDRWGHHPSDQSVSPHFGWNNLPPPMTAVAIIAIVVMTIVIDGEAVISIMAPPTTAIVDHSLAIVVVMIDDLSLDRPDP